jgi:hypothetical protein
MKDDCTNTLNELLKVEVNEAWNQFNIPGAQQPFTIWTQNGLAIDQLRIWAGLRPGQPMLTPPPGNGPNGQPRKAPTWQAGMGSEQIVNLLETLYAFDGSSVTLQKAEPARFAEQAGVRCELLVVRKSDDLPVRVVAWAAVRNNELYLMSFFAPRMAFYDRMLPKVEALVATARITAR